MKIKLYLDNLLFKSIKTIEIFSFRFLSLTKIAFLIIFSVYLFIFFKVQKYNDNEFIIWDAKIYYAYLPSIFIYNDVTLKFTDGNPDLKNRLVSDVLSNGNYINKMTYGVALFASPFFFIGHFAAKVFGFEANGFTKPYGIAIFLGSIFYFLAGIYFISKVLLNYTTQLITSIVILCISFGTNVFFYTIHEGLMSHVYSFFLFAFFIYLTLKWHSDLKIFKSIVIGLVFGAIVLIRPINGLIILFFVLYQVTSFEELSKKIFFFLKNYLHLFIIIFATFLVLIPQFLYWKLITGDFIFYSYQNEKFFFNSPFILEGLFSYRKGWLLYTPLAGLCILGFIYLKSNFKDFVFSIPIIIFLIIYITFSWWCWWYGGCFGARNMVEYLPILAIPFAALIQNWSYSVSKKIILLFLLPFFIYLNIFQTFQYKASYIHWDSTTKATYNAVFLSNKKYFNPYDLKSPNYNNAKRGIDEY